MLDWLWRHLKSPGKRSVDSVSVFDDMDHLEVPYDEPLTDCECLWLENGKLVGNTGLIDPENKRVSPIEAELPSGFIVLVSLAR